jgi:glycosyltransferase involved in cell wall biosynthesis
MAPLFTIAIPTYNRAAFLRKSLACALSQTSEEVEVLVSDNASTDDTPTVVREAGDRVRYVRNDRNIGAAANFLQLVELAHGQFFSFLQDDDLIHCDFARRALAAFRQSEDVVVYAGFAAMSRSHTSFYFPSLYGPPFPLDWTKGAPRTVPGRAVAALSFLMTAAIPPVTAFRTDVLRRAIHHTDPECELFVERIWLSAAAAEGKMVVEPWVAGVFYLHEQQNHMVIVNGDPSSKERELARLVRWLCRFMGPWDDDWKLPLAEVFRESSRQDRATWGALLHRLQGGPEAHPIIGEVLNVLHDAHPEKAHTPSPGPKHANPVKGIIRGLTPPFLWRLGGYCLDRALPTCKSLLGVRRVAPPQVVGQ